MRMRERNDIFFIVASSAQPRSGARVFRRKAARGQSEAANKQVYKGRLAL